MTEAITVIIALAIIIPLLVGKSRTRRECDALSDSLTQAIQELVRLRNELASVRAASKLMRERR